MLSDNNANRIKKKLLIETARLAFEGNLEQKLDELVIKMFPRKKAANRCCAYKERAVVKYRLMAILGHSVEDETNELKTLGAYSNDALKRETVENPILTVIDEACTSCPKGRHFVTNVCRGCVARPCMVNCPKDAITMVDGKARIDEDKCVNCGICLKVCPYHAIVSIPIPCEEACPVGAIEKDENGTESIDYDKCIYCGRCMMACPFGAIMERSQIIDVIKKIKSGRKVIAMLAPAIAGQFPCEFEKIIGAVKALGFSNVIEVAHGADITAQHEAKEFVEKMEQGQRFMTSSCCPVYKEAAKKHINSLQKFISDTPTPMDFTGRRSKETAPDAVTVFVGPCIAKRVEAINTGSVDFVITAEELGAMFVAKDIFVRDAEEQQTPIKPTSEGREFAISGGVTEAVKSYLDSNVDIKPVLIDGLDKKSIKLLNAYSKVKCPGNFVEVMNCQGGCIAGPGNLSSPKSGAKRIKELSDKQ